MALDRTSGHPSSWPSHEFQARRCDDRPLSFPEFAEELRGGEPRSGDHGGGQRRGSGYGGQARYNDLSYGNPGFFVEPFDGTFGAHGGLYDGPAPPVPEDVDAPTNNPPYRAH